MPMAIVIIIMVSARLLPRPSIPPHPTDPGPPSPLLGLTALPQPLRPNLRNYKLRWAIYYTTVGALIAAYSLLPVLLPPNRRTLP